MVYLSCEKWLIRIEVVTHNIDTIPDAALTGLLP